MFWDFAGWRNKLWWVWHVCRRTKSKHHCSNSYPKAHVADLRWSLAKSQQMNRPFCPAMAFTQNWCASTLPVRDHKFGTRLGRFKIFQSCCLHQQGFCLIIDYCQRHSFFEFLSITTVASCLLAKKSSKIVPTSMELLKVLVYGMLCKVWYIYSGTTRPNTQPYLFCFYPSASFRYDGHFGHSPQRNSQVHLLHQCWPRLVPDDGKGLSFQPLTLTTHKTTRSFDAQMTRKQENHGKPQGLSSCNSFSWPRVVLELQDQRQVPGRKLQGCTPLDPPHLAESLGDTCIGDWFLTQSIYCIYTSNIITLYTRYWVASFQSFSTPCCNHPNLLSACYPLSFFPPTSPTSAPEKRCRRDHRASDASRILMVDRRRGMGFDRQNVEGEVGWVVTVSYSSLDLYQKISFVDLYFNRYYTVSMTVWQVCYCAC